MRVQFDDLEFDSATRQIRVAGQEVHVSPKAFDLLGLLIERRPQAVSKPEICEQLWPGTFVSDSSLPSLVSEIREAIGDSHRKRRFIRTLPKHGYAFDAVEENASDDARQARAPGAWLLGAAAEIALFAGDNVLGREGENVILLKSTTVSRRHARIVIGANRATVEDLGSKNGTYLNDKRVTKAARVVEGDQIRIGSFLFTFRNLPGAESTVTQSSRLGTRSRS